MDAGPSRTLVLVRHAKSSWDTDGEDVDRPLSGRGRRDARAIGELLLARDLQSDLVLCSTALRTRETWQGAQAAGARTGDIHYERSIYHAWVPELVGLIRAVPDLIQTLIVIGHAPGIPDLVSHLARRDPESPLWPRLEAKFPTAAVATLSVPGSWSGVGKSRAKLIGYDIARAHP